MNTRRYPRTLQEAFGPYTTHQIEEPPRPLDRDDLIVMWGCAVCAVCVIAMVLIGALK